MATLAGPLEEYWKLPSLLLQPSFQSHGGSAHHPDPRCSSRGVTTGDQLPPMTTCAGSARACKGHTIELVNRRMWPQQSEFPYDAGGYRGPGGDLGRR